MDFSKKFKVVKPATHAKWFELDDAKFLIAPAGNTEVQKKIYSVLSFEEATKLEGGDLTVFSSRCPNAGAVVDLLNSFLVGTVLLNWEGVEEEGQAVPYSEATALEYLRAAEFKNWVDARSAELAEAIRTDADTAKKS